MFSKENERSGDAITEMPFQKSDESKHSSSDDETKKHHPTLCRNVSLFNLQGQMKMLSKKTLDGDQKGEYKIVHYDISQKYVEQEMSHGCFEERRAATHPTNITSILSESKTHCKMMNMEQSMCLPISQFNKAKVVHVVNQELEPLKYLSPFNQSSVCKNASDGIKRNLKDLGFSRYKFIVVVTIGDNKDQGLNITSGFLWDDKRDDFVSQSMKLDDHFIVVNVFAIYLE